MTPWAHRRRAACAAGAVLVGAICLAAGSAPVTAEQASLEGTWSGGGTVILPTGDRERARCRATFHRKSASLFGMNAVCATSSTRVAQTAELSRTSANRFSGEFYNADFAISGSISVTVRGNSLIATLSGGGGSAHFTLSR